MKSIKTIFYFVIGISLFNACGEEFLDSKPITTKTDDTYYTNPAEAEEALAGCYDALQKISGLGLVLAPEMVSDNCFGGSGTTDGLAYAMLDEIDPSVSPASSNVFWGAWKAFYVAIYRCNLLLENIEQINWAGSEELKGEVEAEARTLRAYLYFTMVRLWENIPLLTVPSSEIIIQADPDDTYAQIAEDLLFGIEYGYDEPYLSISNDKLVRANKWVAEALLGRVFLFYTGYYQKSELVGPNGTSVTKAEALGYLDDIIQNSGFGLVGNFADLWPASARYEAAANGNSLDDNTYAGETNKEIMFSVRYTYTGTYGDPGSTEGPDWMDDIGLRNEAYPRYGYGSGWGIATVTPDFYNAYEENDERREASIIAINEENVPYSRSADIQEYTGYFIKKYTIMCDETGKYLSNILSGTTTFQITQYVDFILMRYADVLLMAAELGDPNALQYVNHVHTRAGLDPLTSVDKDIIFDERRFEFAFEANRYWDLLRYDGKENLNYAASALTLNTKVETAGVEVDKIIDGNNIKITKGLFQIPQSEIDLSGNGENKLIQNPGW